MKVYVSTGGFSKLSGYSASKKLLKNNIKNVELSGGLFEKNSINKQIFGKGGVGVTRIPGPGNA